MPHHVKIIRSHNCYIMVWFLSAFPFIYSLLCSMLWALLKRSTQGCDLLLMEMMDVMKRICGFKIVAQVSKPQDASEVRARTKEVYYGWSPFYGPGCQAHFLLIRCVLLSSPPSPSLLQTNSISYATLSFSVVFGRSRGSSSQSSEISSWDKCYISIPVLARTEHRSHGFEWCVLRR